MLYFFISDDTSLHIDAQEENCVYLETVILVHRRADERTEMNTNVRNDLFASSSFLYYIFVYIEDLRRDVWHDSLV